MAYRNFRHLAGDNVLGIDYDIKNRYGTGAYLLHAAVHGGAIEPPTSQLAAYCAGETGAFYSFEALTELTAERLALPVTQFDEPFCVVNTANSRRTVVWLGIGDQREAEQVTYLSGVDTVLLALLTQELHAAGFVVDRAPVSSAGDDPQCIANRNRGRAGVQLALTRSLRASFYANGDLSSESVAQPENRTAAFYAYCAAVQRACALLPRDDDDEESAPTISPPRPVPEGASIAVRTPFAIDHTGAVDATKDGQEQLVDRVHALVGTLPGDRVMRSTYGVPTSASLFAVNPEVARDQLQRAVLDAVAVFEPSAVVSAVSAEVNDNLGTVHVHVEVSRADVPGAERDTTRDVSVLVGGTVVSTPS
ncbi:poly-gamma-glutamate hydrolase family protein [Streptomyces albus]|uniref:poly-gamma-glutamate hydrolase family protein n=1 Tax=Streptomyces albus TaxID=1888 RepID=UPI0036FA0BFB